MATKELTDLEWVRLAAQKANSTVLTGIHVSREKGNVSYAATNRHILNVATLPEGHNLPDGLYGPAMQQIAGDYPQYRQVIPTDVATVTIGVKRAIAECLAAIAYGKVMGKYTDLVKIGDTYADAKLVLIALKGADPAALSIFALTTTPRSPLRFDLGIGRVSVVMPIDQKGIVPSRYFEIPINTLGTSDVAV